MIRRSALVAAVLLVTAACPEPEEDMAGCEPGGIFRDVPPLARGDGPISAVYATTDTGELTPRSTLFVRIVGSGDTPPPLVFLDLDGDRTSGMWTLQSSISAAAWNVLVDPDGTLLHHTGPPTAWDWERIEAPRAGRSVRGGVVDLCIPVAALGQPAAETVRLAVLSGETWVPGPFLAGLDVLGGAEPEPSVGASTPTRLAFQYSARPWLVRNCTDPKPASMACAATAYGSFEHVVLGSGLEEPDHPGHAGTRELIAALRGNHPDTEVWGYVSLIGGPEEADGRRSRVHTVADIADRARAWGAMGATGIFLDEADLCRPEWGQSCATAPDGAPVTVTRERQREAVEAIHRLGLAVFANAFSVLDILGPVGGVRSPLGPGDGARPPDMYLLENPSVAHGEVHSGVDADASRARFALAVQAREATGVRLAAVDTAAGPVSDEGAEPLYALGYARAAQAGVDTYGFTNPSYSAAPETATNLAILGPPEGS